MFEFINRVRSYTRYLIRRYKTNARIKNSKLIIISYPKSGRTWLRMLLCRYIAQKYKITNDLDLYRMTSKIKALMLTDMHHEQANHRSHLRPSDLVFDHQTFSNKHVVFLSRDPRDTAVSMYYQLTTREDADDDGFYQGTFTDLYQDNRYGLEKILAFNQMWLQNIEHVDNSLCITYENMLEDVIVVVQSVLTFMGEINIDTQILIEAIEYSKFENMKKLEKSGKINHSSLKKSLDNNYNASNATKVRKGGSGGYKNYLTDHDIKYTEEMINKYNIN